MNKKNIGWILVVTGIFIGRCSNYVSHDPCIAHSDCGEPELFAQMQKTAPAPSYALLIADPEKALAEAANASELTQFFEVIGGLAKILTQDPAATEATLRPVGESLKKVFVDSAAQVLQSPDIARLIETGGQVVESVSNIVKTVESVLASKNPLGDLLSAALSGGGVSALNPLTLGAMFFSSMGGNAALSAMADDLKALRKDMAELMNNVQKLLNLTSLIFSNQFWLELNALFQEVNGFRQVAYDAKKAGDGKALADAAKAYISAESVEASIYSTISLGVRYADQSTAVVYPTDVFDRHISGYTPKCTQCGFWCGWPCADQQIPNWSPDYFTFASPDNVAPIALVDLDNMIDVMREKLRMQQLALDGDPQRQRLFMAVTAARYADLLQNLEADMERRFKTKVLDKIEYYGNTSWQNLQGTTQAELKSKLTTWAKSKFDNLRLIAIQIRAARVELQTVQMAARN